MKNQKIYSDSRVVMLFLFLVILSLSACKTASDHPKNILAIGDSNGAFKHGWVNQLQQLMPKDSIYNVSIPGNTIGFDNLDNPKLNTLRNLKSYLAETTKNSGELDYILILLGTNDSKAVFDDRRDEVLKNMRTLIKELKGFEYSSGKSPKIVIITPPPYGPDSILAEKYKGGENRVAQLSESFQQIAEETGCEFVNIHQRLKPQFMAHSKDGVHLDAEGQKIIAESIKKKIE